MKIKPIETKMGELHGRDAIYLDNEKYDRQNKRLLLIGEVNGNLCTKQKVGEFIPYTIKFEGVYEFNKIELDEWLPQDKPLFHETSSFYLAEDTSGTKMFIFQTYDWVFEVQCKSYEIIFGKNT